MSELEQESLAPETGPAAAAAGKASSTPPPAGSAVSGGEPAADDAVQAAEDAQAEAERERRATKYLVLTSDKPKGPWEELAQFTANGQVAAKNAGAEKITADGGDPQKKYFLAVPSTSYVPQKPTIKVVTSWD